MKRGDIVICVNNKYFPQDQYSLKVGKKYEVVDVWYDFDDTISERILINNGREHRWYISRYFKKEKELRKEKLKKIGE